ncbi:unnamed protein product [Clonostachys byssicola]|uniref:DUF7730 domain-containing protein n=1 Tax=Clonostachys byssicola TaxID=160290 RepID=A0A9N9Y6N8_9HYPO|nr:unnamed protein product [Clonostachys byssicola]
MKLSASFRKYREGKRREKEFKAAFLEPKSPVKVQITEIQSRTPSPEQNPGLFFNLPPTLRRDILILAFGDRTLHMHLDYQHPFHLRKDIEFQDSFEYIYFSSDQHNQFHGRIQNFKSQFAGKRHDVDRPKEWHWFGCVCHRSPPAGEFGIEQLSCGRTRSRLDYGKELDEDGCMNGAGACANHSGQWPHKCQIQIMGWLLTCRQAYIEGMDVLYRTNTIHISTAPLLRGLQNIMSETVLQHLTSLELVWDADQVPIAHGFKDQARSRPLSTVRRTPVFPYLMFLRIAFKAVEPAKTDPATGLFWPYRSVDEVEKRLRTRLFPSIGDLLNRIVPSTTHVTLSCPDWMWFKATCDSLKSKNADAGTFQVAEIGGVKVWWPIDSTSTALQRLRSPDPLLGDDGTEAPREGFWVHIPEHKVDLDSEGELSEDEDSRSCSTDSMENPFDRRDAF